MATNNTVATKKYMYVAPDKPCDSIPHRTSASDILTEHDYYAIQSNQSIVHKLQSNHELQTIIRNIDSAYDRSGTLDKYMTNNNDFHIFVNELLACINTQ